MTEDKIGRQIVDVIHIEHQGFKFDKVLMKYGITRVVKRLHEES